MYALSLHAPLADPAPRFEHPPGLRARGGRERGQRRVGCLTPSERPGYHRAEAPVPSFRKDPR
jgi:hypothetical protein